jgi:hypothetical protein
VNKEHSSMLLSCTVTVRRIACAPAASLELSLWPQAEVPVARRFSWIEG